MHASLIVTMQILSPGAAACSSQSGARSAKGLLRRARPAGLAPAARLAGRRQPAGFEWLLCAKASKELQSAPRGAERAPAAARGGAGPGPPGAGGGSRAEEEGLASTAALLPVKPRFLFSLAIACATRALKLVREDDARALVALRRN